MDKNQNKHERNNYKSQPQTNRELNKSIIYESKNSPPPLGQPRPRPLSTLKTFDRSASDFVPLTRPFFSKHPTLVDLVSTQITDFLRSQLKAGI